MRSWFGRRRADDRQQAGGSGSEPLPTEGNTARIPVEESACDRTAPPENRPQLRVIRGRGSVAADPGGDSGLAERLGRCETTSIELGGAVQLHPSGPRLPRVGFLRAFIQSMLLVCCCGGAVAAQDGSLWDEREGFRYTNRKAMQVGDLITVVVVESSSGSNRSSLSTSKEHKVNAEGGPGAGPLDFIPLFGVDANVKNELQGSGQVSVSGQLSTTITVEVREIRSNGYLVVEGSRLIDLNGEQEQVTLHGVARPEDIRSDNTISSKKLAEMRINYSGKGAGKSASRPGIFARILGWFF
jgi:flagellar L-ring protein precursor FlgH